MSSASAWLIRRICVYNWRFDLALLWMAGNGMLHCNKDTFTWWVTGFFDGRLGNITAGLLNRRLIWCTMKVMKECIQGWRSYLCVWYHSKYSSDISSHSHGFPLRQQTLSKHLKESIWSWCGKFGLLLALH